MNATDIRTAYLEFFKERGHTVIPSSSLVPENDPTTLFTGSGMQQLVPYLLGMEHSQGVCLADSQKSFRAEDIEEVGDNRHTTFFEMLGNWSLGDYFKQQQLPWLFEFLTEKVGLDPQKLYVTVFDGDPKNNLPRDEESAEIWKDLFAKKGIEANVGERIFYYDAKKNWWSRMGTPNTMVAGEPGGPNSEVFYKFDSVEHDPAFGEACHPNCDCGQFSEIGNSVFMVYQKQTDGSFEPLPKKNVDFGGGLERIAAAVNNDPDIFNINLLRALIETLEKTSGKKYTDNTTSFRIVADHIRSATFLIADGVYPSNTDRGYVVRRLLRRAIRHADLLGISAGTLGSLSATIRDIYKEQYPEVSAHADQISEVVALEEEKFRKTLEEGAKWIATAAQQNKTLSGYDLFVLHTSLGFPFELVIEELMRLGKNPPNQAEVIADFHKHMEDHRAKSRAGAEKKFGGHGLILDTGELKAATEEEVKIVTRLHTATHLLQSALREVLGTSVRQAGSDITAERTRFDFTFDRKLTDEEVKTVEAAVNREIRNALPVHCIEMPKEEAEKTGALFFFKAKYGPVVKVYYMGKDVASAWSKEFCGGPHVENTKDVGVFKIQKQEAVAAGIRRIRGVLPQP